MKDYSNDPMFLKASFLFQDMFVRLERDRELVGTLGIPSQRQAILDDTAKIFYAMFITGE